jgi:hypothetical protein
VNPSGNTKAFGTEHEGEPIMVYYYPLSAFD